MLSLGFGCGGPEFTTGKLPARGGQSLTASSLGSRIHTRRPVPWDMYGKRAEYLMWSLLPEATAKRAVDIIRLGTIPVKSFGAVGLRFLMDPLR